MVEKYKKYKVTREDKCTVRSFIAKVLFVEDRGDFWYIGYKPDDFRIARWGCCRVKKAGRYEAINYTFEEVTA